MWAGLHQNIAIAISDYNPPKLHRIQNKELSGFSIVFNILHRHCPPTTINRMRLLCAILQLLSIKLYSVLNMQSATMALPSVVPRFAPMLNSHKSCVVFVCALPLRHYICVCPPARLPVSVSLPNRHLFIRTGLFAPLLEREGESGGWREVEVEPTPARRQNRPPQAHLIKVGER